VSEPDRELPATYDPPEAQRELVRNGWGELGWLVRRDGKSMVRLDRPNQEILKPYVASEWLPEVPMRPLARQQLARVAFEADRELCRGLGAFAHAMRTWQRLSELERKQWTERGPKEKSGPRATLYKAIMGGLEPYTRNPS
jgi:hypothetical protein